MSPSDLRELVSTMRDLGVRRLVADGIEVELDDPPAEAEPEPQLTEADLEAKARREAEEERKRGEAVLYRSCG